MQIVVWNQVDFDEDGTRHESWQANVVHKAISASGPTAANAVFQLVNWLRKSVDGDDNSVAHIDLVIREAPEFPVTARCRKAFEDAPPIVAERFASAKPFVDTAIDIPDGWDVRVWEG